MSDRKDTKGSGTLTSFAWQRLRCIALHQWWSLRNSFPDQFSPYQCWKTHSQASLRRTWWNPGVEVGWGRTGRKPSVPQKHGWALNTVDFGKLSWAIDYKVNVIRRVPSVYAQRVMIRFRASPWRLNSNSACHPCQCSISRRTLDSLVFGSLQSSWEDCAQSLWPLVCVKVFQKSRSERRSECW